MSEEKQFTIEGMEEAFAATDEPRKTTMPIMSPLNAALLLIAYIRRAVGDPTGKLMQEELVAHCGEIYKRAESYNHLVESLPKSKRPFSDKQAQKVIASQVKRITQLEDDLSFVRCELDKLRKKNPASGS